jgi:hypothetical protein
MSKQHSYQQLELDLWSETVIATSTESQKSEVKKTVRYTCSVEDFKAQQELENDLMRGRGAWLYQQLEREFAFERKQEQILAQFEAMRAEAYKYNF